MALTLEFGPETAVADSGLGFRRLADFPPAYDFTMLRITQQDSSKGAKQYYAVADYYSEGQEIVAPGGRGAERLGLSGLASISTEGFSPFKHIGI